MAFRLILLSVSFSVFLFAMLKRSSFLVLTFHWRMESGVMLHIKSISLSYTLTLISKEIDYISTTGHRYGRLYAGFAF